MHPNNGKDMTYIGDPTSNKYLMSSNKGESLASHTCLTCCA